MDLGILKAFSHYSCSKLLWTLFKTTGKMFFWKIFLFETSLITFNCVPSLLQVIVEQSAVGVSDRGLIWLVSSCFQRECSQVKLPIIVRLKFLTLFCFTKGFTVYDLTTVLGGIWEIWDAEGIGDLPGVQMVVYDWCLSLGSPGLQYHAASQMETASPHICIYNSAQGLSPS